MTLSRAEQQHVRQAAEAWERGDAAFIIQVQGETLFFKNLTRQANAELINEITRIGWTLQGTSEKWAGRRVLTFVRPSSSKPSQRRSSW